MTFKEQFCEEIEEAQELGRKAGLEEGRKEGEHSKALETARNALAMGLTPEQITKLTGLSEDEIRTL